MARRRFPLSGEVARSADRGFFVTFALQLFSCLTLKPPPSASPTPPPKGGGDGITRVMPLGAAKAVHVLCRRPLI